MPAHIDFDDASAKPRWGWWALSIAAHLVVFGSLLLILPAEKPLEQQEQNKTPITVKELEKITEQIKDRQSEELVSKLARIKEIHAQLETIRDTRRERFAQFAGAVSKFAPEDALALQKKALEKLAGIDHIIDGFTKEATVLEEFVKELAAGEPKDDPRVKEFHWTINHRLTDVKVAQVEAREVQQDVLRKLGFLGARYTEVVRAQQAVLDAQAQADGLVEQAEKLPTWDMTSTFAGLVSQYQKSAESLASAEKNQGQAQAEHERLQAAVETTRGKIETLAGQLQEATAAGDEQRVTQLREQQKQVAQEQATLQRDLKRHERPLASAASNLKRRTEQHDARRSDMNKRFAAFSQTLTDLRGLLDAIRKQQLGVGELQRQAQTKLKDVEGGS